MVFLVLAAISASYSNVACELKVSVKETSLPFRAPKQNETSKSTIWFLDNLEGDLKGEGLLNQIQINGNEAQMKLISQNSAPLTSKEFGSGNSLEIFLRDKFHPEKSGPTSVQPITRSDLKALTVPSGKLETYFEQLVDKETLSDLYGESKDSKGEEGKVFRLYALGPVNSTLTKFNVQDFCPVLGGENAQVDFDVWDVLGKVSIGEVSLRLDALDASECVKKREMFTNCVSGVGFTLQNSKKNQMDRSIQIVQNHFEKTLYPDRSLDGDDKDPEVVINRGTLMRGLIQGILMGVGGGEPESGTINQSAEKGPVQSSTWRAAPAETLLNTGN